MSYNPSLNRNLQRPTDKKNLGMNFLLPKVSWPAVTILVAVSVITAPVDARAAESITGPFDYTNAEHRLKHLRVEKSHFTPDVENLVAGKTGTLYADLAYTLRTFPNHHRALNSMARLYRREGGPPRDPALIAPPLEDYFTKAFKFSPRDAMPYMIFAVHQHKMKNYDKALENYQNAMKLGLDSAQLHNNMGLLYADRGDYENSLHHAQIAYEMGYPLPGLRDKLIKAGAWE